MFIYTLSSGAKCYIIPKYGFSQKQAVVSFNYGASDIKFKLNGEIFSQPMGTAHFLEHKMFQKEDKDYFTLFIKNGASSNAYTDANKTAYYFLCKENFYENFELLLRMVTEKYFEEKSVEREKGIIGQEIAMYDDDPNWIVYYNMLKRIYGKNPVANGIAGSRKSISEIDAKTLEVAYDAFYTPENMSIVVCGDVELESVCEIAEKILTKNVSNVKRAEYSKDGKVARNFIKKNMKLSKPVFNIGFKHFLGTNDVKKIYGYKMLLDIIAGESSHIYEAMVDRNMLTQPLGLQYVWGRNVSLSVFSGQSTEPRKIGNGIIREIARFKAKGISDDVFERIKRKHEGRFVRGFNGIDAICMGQTELCSINSDLFDAYEAIKCMEKDYIEELLSSFSIDRAVLSVVE